MYVRILAGMDGSMLRVMRVPGGEGSLLRPARCDRLPTSPPASVRVCALIGDAVSRMMCLMRCGGLE